MNHSLIEASCKNLSKIFAPQEAIDIDAYLHNQKEVLTAGSYLAVFQQLDTTNPTYIHGTTISYRGLEKHLEGGCPPEVSPIECQICIYATSMLCSWGLRKNVFFIDKDIQKHLANADCYDFLKFDWIKKLIGFCCYIPIDLPLYNQFSGIFVQADIILDRVVIFLLPVPRLQSKKFDQFTADCIAHLSIFEIKTATIKADCEDSNISAWFQNPNLSTEFCHTCIRMFLLLGSELPELISWRDGYFSEIRQARINKTLFADYDPIIKFCDFPRSGLEDLRSGQYHSYQPTLFSENNLIRWQASVPLMEPLDYLDQEQSLIAVDTALLKSINKHFKAVSSGYASVPLFDIDVTKRFTYGHNEIEIVRFALWKFSNTLTAELNTLTARDSQTL